MERFERGRNGDILTGTFEREDLSRRHWKQRTIRVARIEPEDLNRNDLFERKDLNDLNGKIWTEGFEQEQLNGKTESIKLREDSDVKAANCNT